MRLVLSSEARLEKVGVYPASARETYVITSAAFSADNQNS